MIREQGGGLLKGQCGTNDVVPWITPQSKSNMHGRDENNGGGQEGFLGSNIQVS